MNIRNAVVAVLGAFFSTSISFAAPAPLRVMIAADVDADAIVLELSRALPIKHRHYYSIEKVLLVTNDPPDIEFVLAASASAELERTLNEIVSGKLVPGASFAVDLRRTVATVTRAKPVRAQSRTAMTIWGPPDMGKTKVTHGQTFPGMIDRVLDGMLGGTAPAHLNYFIVHWNPYRNIAAIADSTLAKIAQRGLLTEPSYDELLADDRLVPVPARATFVHEVATQIQAGVANGWRAKTVIWRSDDVATFEALKSVRTASCARKLMP